MSDELEKENKENSKIDYDTDFSTDFNQNKITSINSDDILPDILSNSVYINGLNRQIDSLKQHISYLEDENQNYKQIADELFLEKEKISKIVINLSSENKALNKKLLLNDKIVSDLQRENASLKNQIETLKKENQILQNNIKQPIQEPTGKMPKDTDKGANIENPAGKMPIPLPKSEKKFVLSDVLEDEVFAKLQDNDIVYFRTLTTKCAISNQNLLNYTFSEYQYQSEKFTSISILSVASHLGRLEILKILLKDNQNTNILNPTKGRPPLLWACICGDLDVVKYLIQKGAFIGCIDVDGKNSMILASINGHLELVKYLILKGIDVNFCDVNNRTALMMASLMGHLEIVILLIANGSIVDLKDANQNTALIRATWNGNLDIVKYLAKNSLNINEKCNHGYTALMMASLKGHVEIVKFLLKHGADKSITNEYGKTAFDVICHDTGNTSINKDSVSKNSISNNPKSEIQKMLK